MAFPTRTGVYQARIAATTLEPGKNGNIAFVADFDLVEWYGENDAEWYNVEYENTSIRAWLYLLKNDGSPNEISLQQIRDALDWNGELGVLGQPGRYDHVPVQILVQSEEYNNQTRMRVKSIRSANANPADPFGSSTLKPADPTLVGQLAAQYDAKFRAILGESTGPAVRRGAPPASQPVPAPTRTAPAPATGGPSVDKDTARVTHLKSLLDYCVEAANAPKGEPSGTIEYWCEYYSSFDGKNGVRNPDIFLSHKGKDPNRHAAAMALLEKTIARIEEVLVDYSSPKQEPPVDDLPF